MRKKSLTHPKMQSAQRPTTRRPVTEGLWYLRVCARQGDPKRRKRRSTRPHFGRGPFTSAAAAAAVRVGRPRGSMDDGEYGLKHNDRGDVYGRRSGRLASNGGRHGVRTPKIRAVQISHLSFHARHLRVAIGDIGI